MNGILEVIKKVGHGILAVAKWPFQHAAQLAHILGVTDKEIKVVQQLAPATREALVQLVVLIEHLGPDVVAAIASKGFDVPADLRASADVQAVFAFVKDTLFPTIETDYQQIVQAAESGSAPAPAALPSPELLAPAAGGTTNPGLHNVVPA